jgi:hypothetical protein
MASGDEAALTEVLRDVPTELHAQARVVRDAGSKGNDSPDVEAAVSAILVWTELDCQRADPRQPTRRIAPPPDATLEGRTLCNTSASAGLVVRIVGLGVPLEAARDVAERSRALSDDEWAAVVRSARPSGTAGC